jgi:large subunit ribosomal protein L4
MTMTLRGPVKKEKAAPVERTVARRDTSGQVLGQVALEPTIFGIEPNVPVMHQVTKAQLNARRAGTQSTKTRAEVRGGGKKPFSQKGTGRARQGTPRASQFTGGGVALGPKPRKYAEATPKKMIKLALLSALSDRAAIERVALVDLFAFEAPKTKDAVKVLSNLGLDGKVLIIVSPSDEATALSFRNVPNVTLQTADQLNAYDVLLHDWILFTDATLPVAEKAEAN